MGGRTDAAERGAGGIAGVVVVVLYDSQNAGVEIHTHSSHTSSGHHYDAVVGKRRAMEAERAANAVGKEATASADAPCGLHSLSFSLSHTPHSVYMWTAMDRVRASGSVILWIGK